MIIRHTNLPIYTLLIYSFEQGSNPNPGLTDLPQAMKEMPSHCPQVLDICIKFTPLRQRSNNDHLKMRMALIKGARELCLCGVR